MEEDINTLLNNKPEAVRYRRSLSTLIILGTGIIVFGFWGIIKLAAQLFFGIDLFRPGDLDGFDETAKMIVTVLVFVFMAIDVILRLIVGLKAIREGREKKTGKGYLVICLFLIIVSAYSVYLLAADLINMEESFIDSFVAVFMELSSLVIALEVFIAGISVKRYKSKHIVRVN